MWIKITLPIKVLVILTLLITKSMLSAKWTPHGCHISAKYLQFQCTLLTSLISYFLSFLLRYDFSYFPHFAGRVRNNFTNFITLHCILKLILWLGFKLYLCGRRLVNLCFILLCLPFQSCGCSHNMWWTDGLKV